ncbi:hypothetical protein K457DRAFT_193520 [Linnemannia elongata AG-77]|uniref:Protein kinase domain-containing protein n=1 Tax=Linnemannia elongata AG-77 TaxID=1314771 RepID=A0A197KBG5_9FUNG|nr:hypothetical protein K457DRAFT_193520 [Linnemannia elongata AG-77]
MAPLLEQLKNFIRHGKSGKDMKPRESSSSSAGPTSSSRSSKSRNASRNNSPSRNTAASVGSTATGGITSAATPVDIQDTGAATAAAVNATNFNNNNTEAASRIVAEEKQQKSKMPVYPGLERYRLVEKMGDGAFSNVYKAYDTKMDRLVAVKVVRKFELNAHQVTSLYLSSRLSSLPPLQPLASFLAFLFSYLYPNCTLLPVWGHWKRAQHKNDKGEEKKGVFPPQK